MAEFLSIYYLWIKAFHIMAVIAWMAGLFYLPRLYVYHTRVDVGSDQDSLFQLMEMKLLRIIMNPAMIVTWVFGILLLLTNGVASEVAGWVYVKLGSVLLLSIFHMKLAGWRKAFAQGRREKSESFFRKVNEVPTILMIIIVIAAVVKPF